MADDRTTVTELATALGMTGHPTLADAIEARPAILKLEPDEWANLEGIWSSGSWTSVAETAFGNGAYFASHTDGLNGRAPQRIEWSGRRRIPGDRPVPADLVVDRVYMVSCKYLSRILHNTAPAHVFIDGLAVTSQSRGINWFQEVAAEAHEALYARTVEVLGLTNMAESPVSQTQEQRTGLRLALKERAAPGLPDGLDTEYERLIEEVSRESAQRWEAELGDRGQQERMLWRLLRIYSSTYFILGNDERHTMRLRVATPWEWQQSYKFSSFEVRAAGRGQPRVNWVASYRHLASGQRRRVGGHIEIRWSHRPFFGSPEAKIYLDTPHEGVPGYLDLDGRSDTPLYEQQRLISNRR